MEGIKVDKPNRSNYRVGLDRLRERFKEAKFVNDYDAMADAIENIKSEIKSKMIGNGEAKIVLRIENICEWYRKKEAHYTQNTEEGMKIIFSPDIVERVNHNLTIAYELLIHQLEKLGLLS